MTVAALIDDAIARRRIEEALLRATGFYPGDDPNGDAWIHEDDDGYVMSRDDALADAVRRVDDR